MNILVVEDDELTAEFVKKALKSDKHHVQVVHDGNKGFECAKSQLFDAIILDIMLPGKNGIEICKDLRRQRIATPILILSSKSSEASRVLGLDSGADDYLVKPFSYKELQARIRAITRRPSTVIQSQLKVGDLTLDPTRHVVLHCEKVIPLRPKEYELLEYMMRNPNVALTRQQLLQDVWGVVADNSSNRVEVHIRQLRNKIKCKRNRQVIMTVRNVGYKLSS